MPLSQDEHFSYKQMRRQIYKKNTINVKCLFTSLHQVTHTVLRTSGYLVHSLNVLSINRLLLNTLDGRANLVVLSQLYLSTDTTDKVKISMSITRDIVISLRSAFTQIFKQLASLASTHSNHCINMNSLFCTTHNPPEDIFTTGTGNTGHSHVRQG